MNNELTTDEKNRKRLPILIISRLAIITLFLGVAISLSIERPLIPISQVTIKYLYLIIATTYFLTIIYVLLLKFLGKVGLNIYLQITLDVFLITALVYLTGSFSSNYSLIYTLVIIYSVIFLGRKGGLVVASASGIFYGILLDFEYFRLIPSALLAEHGSDISAGEVFVRILVHIVSFYILAFLASYAVEQEKKTRSLLEEKESAFDQLDLLFRSIVESVDTGVMTIDLQGRIKTFNRAAEVITGFSLEVIQNRRIDELFPEFNSFLAYQKNSNESKSRKEVQIQGRKGGSIHLGCSISALKNKNNQQIGNIFIFQDLSEIKQMEESLEKSKRLALIGEMAAGLAHEMRNPLASIAGSIELLTQGLVLDETDKRLMQIILRGKDQLDSFVRDFLLLARPIPEKREPVNVYEITSEVLDNLKLSNDWSEKITVVQKLENKINIMANKEQIRQVIRNLALNAVQAMKEEGGTLSIEIKEKYLEDRKEYVEIKIGDTGQGIEVEDMKKVFEPFFTNKEKGTGLGLTIVGRIVEGYKGKIKIDSKINQGTTCIVLLPCENEIIV